MSDPGRLFGLDLIVSPYVEPDTLLILGKFEKPANWAELSEEEQLRIAARHGAKVVMSPDYFEKVSATETPG